MQVDAIVAQLRSLSLKQDEVKETGEEVEEAMETPQMKVITPAMVKMCIVHGLTSLTAGVVSVCDRKGGGNEDR